jgi:hypothetical protein
MVKGLINDNWGYVAACLANTDDENQIKFFKAFIEECKSWGTHFQIQQQLASINQKLDKEEKELLSMLSYQEDA